MSKRTLACLVPVFTLAACGVTPEADRGARTYKFDWPAEGIRAVFVYDTVQIYQPKPVCAGRLSIENYGSRNYTVLLLKVSVYSASKELIATDRFSLASSFTPGSRAEITADRHNPLDPVVVTMRFGECPKDMASVEVQLEAF